jgi:AcrR family transcriptional regulator
MRITPQVKLETRQRILEAAARILAAQGWEGATTRDISAAAGVGTGTIFNYFETKEAIAAALIEQAWNEALGKFQGSRTGGESLEEDLFSLIWTALKALRRFRRFLASAAEVVFSPLVRSKAASSGDTIRVRHLEAVEQIAQAHGVPGPLPAVTVQLYWTLFLGVFVYWAADRSAHQEDTLALLDQSLKLFLAALPKPSAEGCVRLEGAETDENEFD